jgi:uncharacterized protein (DUF1501 family)
MSVAPASFTSPATVAALQSAAAAGGGDDFRAVICIFLFGGNDGHQMLVPRTGVNAAVYQAARPFDPATTPVTNNVGVGLTETPLHEINADYRFHPRMVNMFQAWNDSKLAVVREVGTLNQPTTKDLYFANPRNRPDQLFAHNIQQDQWQAADMPYTPRITGWFGRAANLMDPYFNAGLTNPISGMMSIAGQRLQTRAYGGKRPSVFGASNTTPIQLMPVGSAMGFTGFNSLRDLMYEGVVEGPVHRNAMHQMMSAAWNDSKQAQATLNTSLQPLPAAVATLIDNATPAVTLPNSVNQGNPLREALKVATRLLLSRGSSHFNHRRQMIFLQLGGFDNHNNLRANHDHLVAHIDNAVGAFRAAMAHADVNLTNNVTLFFETEFGRTMQSNGTKGTDHGWSNHSFVVGGPVVGGMYGQQIDYTLGGPDDTGNPGSSALGRYIPRMSIEQYYAEILRWFGLPESVMPLALPNYAAFSPTDLGFLP